MEFNRLLSSAISTYGEPNFNSNKNQIKKQEKQITISKKEYPRPAK